METVNIHIERSANQQEAFVARDGNDKLGEMVFRISGTAMTVFHTEVFPQAEGKGIAKQLLGAMVAHARQLNLSVVPRCVFVLAQFKRHPELFADLWTGK